MPRKKSSTTSSAKKTVRKKKTVSRTEVITPAVTESIAVKSKTKTYYYAVGRRKSSVARVRLHKKGESSFLINEKPYKEYFSNFSWQKTVESPLVVVEQMNAFPITVKVEGGGLRGQAESIRLGIARALILINPEHRSVLKRAGFLKRDSRVKERKKYGLKRARRAPQWSKR